MDGDDFTFFYLGDDVWVTWGEGGGDMPVEYFSKTIFVPDLRRGK